MGGAARTVTACYTLLHPVTAVTACYSRTQPVTARRSLTKPDKAGCSLWCLAKCGLCDSRRTWHPCLGTSQSGSPLWRLCGGRATVLCRAPASSLRLQERLQSTRQSLHIYMCWSAGQATSKRSSRSVLRTRCYDRLQPVYSLLQPVGWLRAHRPKRPRQTVWYLVRRRCVCSLDGRCCSGHYSLLQPVASCYSLLQPVTV